MWKIVMASVRVKELRETSKKSVETQQNGQSTWTGKPRRSLTTSKTA